MTAIAQKTPKDLFWILIAVSCAPLLLNRFGVDFGMEPLHWQQKGLVHALFVWTAVAMAGLSAVLAAVVYRASRDLVLPILGLTLVCSACFDMFHLFAVQRLMRVGTSSPDLLPFSWAVARSAHALVPAIAAWLLLLRGPEKPGRGSLMLLSVAAIGLGVAAFFAIRTTAAEVALPRTMFPGDERVFGIVSRPIDLLPLAITLFAALFVFPRLHRRSRSFFSATLWLTVIPFTAMQLHLAFGSQAPFDNDFVIAQFLLIVTCLVPFGGIAMHFMNTFDGHAVARQRLEDLQLHLDGRRAQIDELKDEVEHEVSERRRADAELKENREALRQMYEATYASTHDLQEPLRELIHINDTIQRDLGDDLPGGLAEDLTHIDSALRRMESRVQSLLSISEPRASETRRERVSLRECADRAIDLLQGRIQHKKVRVEFDELPEVWGDRTILANLYHSLIDHALERVGGRSPRIKITAQYDDDRLVLGVRDNGPRPESDDIAQFFTEHERNTEGLEACKRAVDQHRGTIWIEPLPRAGCHVRFTLESRARDAVRE